MPRADRRLYTALTGRPADGVLVLLEQRGKGRLFACSPEFVDAMADADAELTRLAVEDEERGVRPATSFLAARDALDRAWLAAGSWPSDVVGTANRLGRMYWARMARERGQRLYVWHGPRVPEFRVVSGRGPYPGEPR